MLVIHKEKRKENKEKIWHIFGIIIVSPSAAAVAEVCEILHPQIIFYFVIWGPVAAIGWYFMGSLSMNFVFEFVGFSVACKSIVRCFRLSVGNMMVSVSWFQKNLSVTHIFKLRRRTAVKTLIFVHGEELSHAYDCSLFLSTSIILWWFRHKSNNDWISECNYIKFYCVFELFTQKKCAITYIESFRLDILYQCFYLLS